MSRQGLIELEAVLAITRRGTFRAAARELGLSTTALSNTIGKLERAARRSPVQSHDPQRLAH